MKKTMSIQHMLRCVPHHLNNSICVWMAARMPGCVVCMHIGGVTTCEVHGSKCTETLVSWLCVFITVEGNHKTYFYSF